MYIFYTKGLTQMTINLQSDIDKELAKLYADKVTVNVEQIERMSIEDVLSQMQIIATTNLINSWHDLVLPIP